MGENISGIKYLNNIELMPLSMGLSVRSKKEILDRFLVDYTIASIATYAFCSSHNLIKPFLTTIDNKYQISKIINSKDKELIINIYNKKINKSNLENITFRFESCNLCMWFLGLSDSITYKGKCSVKKINDLILSHNTYKELLDKCNLRNVKEVIEYYSVISKIIYSNNSLDSTTKQIINNQDSIIKYIVLYNFNKNGLKVQYSKNNFKFEFILPSNLKFVNIPNVLFALKNDTIKVLAQEIVDGNIQNNLKLLTSNRFKIIDVSYVRSLYIEKRILKVKITRDDLHINMYYILLGNHLIRIDFSSSKLNIESDIIYSIKIFE